MAPKVLIYDIETAPIQAYVWGLWNNDVGLNQIKSDWHVLSYSAKWLGEQKIMYKDQSKVKNIEDDRELLQGIWKLLDAADVVITQNGKKFDQRKLNARFVINKMKPPSSYKHIDTCEIARRVFGFTSNRLEYMADALKLRYRKKVRRKFEGFALWTECLKQNKKAWAEMQSYNRMDVLVLEELYKRLQPWDTRVNFNLYHDSSEVVCNCGGIKFRKIGFRFTAAGKFQRYRCLTCGAESRSSVNLFSTEKRSSLRRP